MVNQTSVEMTWSRLPPEAAAEATEPATAEPATAPEAITAPEQATPAKTMEAVETAVPATQAPKT